MPNVKLRQASNCCLKVLEAVKLVYAKKTKDYMTSQKFDCRSVLRIANSVLSKVKSAILSPYNGPEVFPSACDKTKTVY